MYEGIKIVSMLECIRGFATKCWINIRQSKMTIISLSK